MLIAFLLPLPLPLPVESQNDFRTVMGNNKTIAHGIAYVTHWGPAAMRAKNLKIPAVIQEHVE
jgi:hypothetical protein